MRGENWEEIQENRKWWNRMIGDFSLRVDPYLGSDLTLMIMMMRYKYRAFLNPHQTSDFLKI